MKTIQETLEDFENTINKCYPENSQGIRKDKEDYEKFLQQCKNELSHIHKAKVSNGIVISINYNDVIEEDNKKFVLVTYYKPEEGFLKSDHYSGYWQLQGIILYTNKSPL